MATRIYIEDGKIYFIDVETGAFKLLDIVTLDAVQTITGVKTFNATPKMDIIAEKTAGVGVTIDGILLKDNLSVSGITPIDGWVSANETWTFSSVDDPTGVFTISGDVTTKYSIGMRLKMTNGGNTIYGIISKTPTYSAPNTTITFLHEIDPTDSLALYLMANSAITNPYYSVQKVPFGFPPDPKKWTVWKIDTTERSQATPTQNVWYNLGSISIPVPIGAWNVSYQGLIKIADATAGSWIALSTLSTANNSQSDVNWTCYVFPYVSTTGYGPFAKHGLITVTSKTSYYFNTRTTLANMDTLYNANDVIPLILQAICAYL